MLRKFRIGGSKAAKSSFSHKQSLIFILTLLLMIYSPMSSKVAIQPASASQDPPANAVWTIDPPEVVTKSNTKIILNESLRIFGELTLDNVTLIMNSTSGSHYNITVYDGGSLTIKGDSTVTAENSTIPWFLVAENGSSIELSNSTFSYAGYEDLINPTPGISIETNDAKVHNCTFKENYNGICFYRANNALITNNTITWIWGIGGIRLSYSNESTIRNNIVKNNEVAGVRLEYSTNSLISGNTFTSNLVGVSLKYSKNCTVEANHITTSREGISFYRSYNNSILENNIADSNVMDNFGGSGIYFNKADNNTVCGNTITNNEYTGMNVYESNNNSIMDNTISQTTNNLGTVAGYGAHFLDSHNNSLKGNSVIDSKTRGLDIVNSEKNVIDSNFVTNGGFDGVFLAGYSPYNLIINNVVTDCEWGISLYTKVSHCLLYGNALADNVGNARDENGTSQWDNGTHGNWYDDYTGPDWNHDGIGDVPYNIDFGLAQDRYPLFNVTDSIPPTINTPADLSYEVGETGKTLVWQATDSYPYWYNVTRNNTLVAEGIWDGTSITINIDGLAVGHYTYTITVYDTLGNSATDSVIVTVTETPATTTEPAESEPETSETKPEESEAVIIPGFTIGMLLILFGPLVIFRHRSPHQRKD